MQLPFLALLIAAVFQLFFDRSATALAGGAARAAGADLDRATAAGRHFWGGVGDGGRLQRPADLRDGPGVIPPAPVLCVSLQGAGAAKMPAALDFAAILLIWLPIELAAGAPLCPPVPARGFLHSVAYGIAILLGLTLFIGYRTVDGLKYNLPRARRDFPGCRSRPSRSTRPRCWRRWASRSDSSRPRSLAGAHRGAGWRRRWRSSSRGRRCRRKYLFRMRFQNFLMLRLGASTRTLLLGELHFRLRAPLDNGPQAVPNWRYMILATMAGVAYGKVFQKIDHPCFRQRGMHTMVDWTKHFYF